MANRQSAYGVCGNLLLARLRLFLAYRSYGRAGKTPLCRRKIWARISGNSRRLVDEFGYIMPIYGHFGQGCIHTRISYDMRSVEGVKAYREFIDRAADLVLELGGSLSGEHGDGQSRGALLPKMFGPELMQAFREFKALWDPDNRMNPGKMMGTPGEPEIYQPDEKLRVGPGYEAARPHTHFAFPDDDGAFSHATMRCVGVGACRKTESATMCPSYMATREEQHSTRGRAHLLWELMQSDVLPDKWRNQQVHEALDLCLSCKACKHECPVRVDMATYKAEFLAQHYKDRLHPLPHYLFGFMDRWARLASIAPSLANATMELPGVEAIAKRIADVAPARSLPRFASRSFLKQQDAPALHENDEKTVLLWPDTWNNYLQPQVLDAAARVLRSAGFRVVFPRRHICCGRPLYDFGFLDQARRYLDDVLARLAPQIDAGMPFIVLEPSCASVFLEELRNFYPDSERAKRLGKQTYLLADFLAAHAPQWKPPSLMERSIVLHGHCHHKAIFNMKAEHTLLQQTGAQVTMLDSGCCGMAGPFGFERDKYEVSQTLGERVLLPAVRAADREHHRSSPTASVAASRSRRTPAATPFTSRRYWRKTSVQRRSNKTGHIVVQLLLRRGLQIHHVPRIVKASGDAAGLARLQAEMRQRVLGGEVGRRQVEIS